MDENRALLQENDRSPEQEEVIDPINTDLNLLLEINKERKSKQVSDEKVIS